MVLNKIKTNGARPFAMAIAAMLIALAATATIGGGKWASAQDGTEGTAPDASVTAEANAEIRGQLVRRGLFGEAKRVGDDSFLVETRHGDILVLVNSETVIHMPPKGIVQLEKLEVGAKVGVLLTKPTEEEEEQAPASDVFRTGTALKVLIVPDRATRQHIRAVIVEKAHGRVRFIDRDGDEREIETDVEVEGEAGEELVLITQDTDVETKLRIRAAARAEIVSERLDRLAEARVELRERLEQVKARVEEDRVEVRDRVRATLDRIEVDADVRLRIEEQSDAISARIKARLEAAAERDKVDDMRDRSEEDKDEDRSEEEKGRPEDATDPTKQPERSRDRDRNADTREEDTNAEAEAKTEAEAEAEAEVDNVIDAKAEVEVEAETGVSVK